MAKMVTIRLSPRNARLVALNIDGWLDAGACDGGLEPAEWSAIRSAYDQILRCLGGKLTLASIEADEASSVPATQPSAKAD